MHSGILLDAAEALVAAARRHGADAAEAIGRASLSRGVAVRLGALEDIDASENREVGLRAFVGRRSASVSAADLSPAGLEELAERAVAMARLAPEDPYAGLAPPGALARGSVPELEIADDADPTPEQLRERALEIEDAARAVPGVTNSEGGSASASRAHAVLVTSAGFAGHYGGTAYSLSASVIAGEGAGMQRDHAMRSARHLADLPNPGEVGRLAGERAVARLSPAAIRGGAMPVVFDRRVSASLVAHLLGAMGAPSIARKSSFLAGRADDAVFAPGIRIVEDPFKPRGMRSRPFDGEGVACTPRTLVEGGRVTGWLTNVASAAQLGLALTGHASRGGSGAPGVGAANVDLLGADETLEEMIADIADGILVDYLIGQGVNPVTGDYSRGAAGRRIVNGRIGEPVAGFTIAGNLLAMFSGMRAANDRETWRAINAPSLRIEGMTVAGG
ncbi:TldD/PmbA family protein [Tsuneonella sp. YG55]|uniref:TldD/PmbA family protein n=1 Tax=Tsuneonella litorea TaxID=2976475 RepID=A0A9X3AKB7_9SPHN|nr:TldD/PmbA family protein [Tsuneonella litorea]MCT2557613.1 TldD/PmbA family protein [Tsuneonella litorea]